MLLVATLAHAGPVLVLLRNGPIEAPPGRLGLGVYELENRGDAPAHVEAVTLEGDAALRLVDWGPTEVPPGGVFRVGVTWTAIGDAAGSLHIRSERGTVDIPVRSGGRGRDVEILGDLDKSAVDAAMRTGMSGIRACYDATLVATPGVEGWISLSYVIEGDGRVTSVVADASGADTLPVAGCAVEQVRTWKLPPSANGGRTLVRYPLELAG